MTRIGLILAAVTLVSACATTEEDRYLRQIELAEKREQAAMERQACEESSSGAWMCTSGNRRANEREPWLYCGCVDNQQAISRRH